MGELRALGAAGFSSSTVLSEAKRLVPFAERHPMFVAMHNHNNLVDPDQFATPHSFEQALAMSEYFKVTLDIGHFVAGNNDPVAFIGEHHDRIVNIHVRDRKRDNGPNRPFGEGDTPIKDDQFSASVPLVGNGGDIRPRLGARTIRLALHIRVRFRRADRRAKRLMFVEHTVLQQNERHLRVAGGVRHHRELFRILESLGGHRHVGTAVENGLQSRL